MLELNKSGHIRTPHYIRHQTGTVIQFCGAFLNPEDLAIGKASGPVVECYRVEFLQCDVWKDYGGMPEDTLVIEVYEHWMRPSDEEATHG
ncbi:SH3-like domain-containing protein [Methylobacterium sp.]|uniref:SH3-like domain-containing protein n=1 Tax=Methylobacterium sp. TaxID=409 RepID=UPI003B0288E5